MREIKFRAWDGDCLFTVGTLSYIESSDSLGVGNCEVMQYTGLKDKNGVGIYDDLIVRDNVGRVFVVAYHEEEAAHVFEWSKDAEQYGLYRDFNSTQLPLEVIGNIYENPELLEKPDE